MTSFILRQIEDVRSGNRHILKVKILRFTKLIYQKLIFPIFILPIFIIPVICIRIISSKIIFRFGYLESRAIGHFSQFVEIYLSEIDNNIHKNLNVRTIDIWCFQPKICNKYLARKWRKYFNILPWFIVIPIITINKMMPGRIHEVPYRYHDDDYGLPWQYQDFYDVYKKSKCHVSFTTKEIKEANALLNTVNINLEDKIVTVLVRDIAYWGFCSDTYRNSNIKIVEPAIKSLAKLGYKVVRMGQKVSAPLSIKHKNVLDYSQSSINSEFLDLFIISKCKFYIDTGSGLGGVAAMFRRPTLFFNYPELHYLCIHPTDLFIPKHFWSIEEKRMLTFREIIKIKAHYFSDDTHYKKAKIESVDNTPEEILEAVIEMEKRISNTWNTQKDEDKLQQKLKNIWKVEERRGVSIPKISYNFLINNSDFLN